MNNENIKQLKQIIEGYYGNGGKLSEDWWFDFFLGVGLKGFSVGYYDVTTTEI